MAVWMYIASTTLINISLRYLSFRVLCASPFCQFAVQNGRRPNWIKPTRINSIAQRKYDISLQCILGNEINWPMLPWNWQRCSLNIRGIHTTLSVLSPPISKQLIILWKNFEMLGYRVAFFFAFRFRLNAIHGFLFDRQGKKYKWYFINIFTLNIAAAVAVEDEIGFCCSS